MILGESHGKKIPGCVAQKHVEAKDKRFVENQIVLKVLVVKMHVVPGKSSDPVQCHHVD